MNQMASKLANSVRQVKTQQGKKTQKEQENDVITKAPKTTTDEAPLAILPSKRPIGFSLFYAPAFARRLIALFDSPNGQN